mgnify:CR=1 FL=1
MNENQNVDIDREQDNGQITYANEVISTIVSVATTEVDGISAIAGNSGLLGKGKLPRGVRVDMNGEDVSVDVSVTVDYGMPIQKVGRSAQENVRKSIESMTGLHVEKVDLHVGGGSFEKENEELQQSQKIALSLEAEEEQHALEEGKAAQETQAQERAEDEPADEAAAEAAAVPSGVICGGSDESTIVRNELEEPRRVAGASSSGSVGTAVRARTSSMETRRGMEERLRERSPGTRVVTES